MTNPAEQPASMSLRERIHQVMRDAGATNSAAQKGADYILDAIASEPAAMSARMRRNGKRTAEFSIYPWSPTCFISI
jgi:hypothetical protein